MHTVINQPRQYGSLGAFGIVKLHSMIFDVSASTDIRQASLWTSYAKPACSCKKFQDLFTTAPTLVYACLQLHSRWFVRDTLSRHSIETLYRDTLSRHSIETIYCKHVRKQFGVPFAVHYFTGRSQWLRFACVQPVDARYDIRVVIV